MASAPSSNTKAVAANVGTVDHSLWWDSFVTLFHELEHVPSSVDLPPHLVDKIKDHQAWFQDAVSMFRCPNELSRCALNAKQIGMGLHHLVIRPELKEAAIEVSSSLCLDEVQSYILLDRLIEVSDVIGEIKVDNFLHMVLAKYCLERQCLLKCIREVFVHSLYVQRSLHEHCKNGEVLRLIVNGLDKRLSLILHDLASSKHLECMGVDFASLWVDEALLEISLVLDIIFIAYYEGLCTFNCGEWKSLCNLFKGILYDSMNMGRLTMSPEARNSLCEAKARLLFVLIEMFDLDSILQMVHDGVPFRQGSSSFSVVDVQEIDALMSSFTVSEITEASPLVLAWAVVLCLIASLPENHDHNMFLEIDHAKYVRQAFEAAPFRYLVEILDSKMFKDSDSPITGYRSVVRTVISAFIASYERSDMLEEETLHETVDLLCKIYRGEEMLCMQFWDRDSYVDSPVRSLLFFLENKFPYRAVELIRLISALSEGSWPAECVYNFLDKMAGLTSLFEILPSCHLEKNCEVVITSCPLSLPGIDGIYIPEKTRGRILKWVDGNLALVRWEVLLSGFIILLQRLEQEHYLIVQKEIFSTLDLILRLITFNKVVCLALMNVVSSLPMQQIQWDGSAQNTSCIDIVKIICILYKKLGADRCNIRLMSMCIHILCKLMECSPYHVVMVTTSTNVLALGTACSSSGTQLLWGHVAETMLLDCEQGENGLCLTISAIDLAEHLVEAGVEDDMLSSFVAFLLQFVFVNHEHCKYNLHLAHWRVIVKVLELVKKCIGLFEEMPKLGCLVRDLLLYDSSVRNAVFKIITTPSLEGLYLEQMCEMNEIDGLQDGIISAIEFVYALVFRFTKDVIFSLPVFFQAELSSGTRDISIVKAAISLISFHRNQGIQVAAAKLLSLLCVAAEKRFPDLLVSISLVLHNTETGVLRSTVLDILHKEATVSEDLLVTVLKLLSAAAHFQPVFFSILMPKEENVEVMTTGAFIKKHSSSFFVASGYNISKFMDVILRYLRRAEDLFRSRPRLLLNILKFLKALWRWAEQYDYMLELLRASNDFWKILASIVEIGARKRDQVAVEGDSDPMYLVYIYQCQAAVLDIMACEIFFHRKLWKNVPQNGIKYFDAKNGRTVVSEKGQPVDLHDLKFVLSSWFEGLVVDDLVKIYAPCDYGKEHLYHVRMTTSLFLIHAMDNILSGNVRCLSSSLVRRINLIFEKLSKQPAYIELLQHYTSHGFSMGKKIKSVILNDLYYHLQGELEGRKIAPGPYKELSQYLYQLETFRSAEFDYDYEFYVSDKFIQLFDTDRLKEHCGFEFWMNPRWKAFNEIAGRMFKHMSSANVIMLNLASKCAALKALGAMLYVCFDNVADLETASLHIHDGGFLLPCIDYLCKNLQATRDVLFLDSDFPAQVLNSLVAQAELVLYFVRFLQEQASLGAGDPSYFPVHRHTLKTASSMIRLLLDVWPSSLRLSESISLFLVILLTSLQFGYSEWQEKGELVASDVSNDGHLFNLNILLILCNCLQVTECHNLALAAMDTMLKGFLTPDFWLPALQKYLDLHHMTSKIQERNPYVSISVTLKFLLTLAKNREGALMLQNSNIFSCIKGVFAMLFDSEPLIEQDQRNLPVPFINEKCEHIWGLALAVIIAMVHSLGEDAHGIDFVEKVTFYFFVEKVNLVSYYLSVLHLSTETNSNAANTLRTRISRMDLFATEHTLLLLCTLATHQWTSTRAVKGMASLREICIHLLSFISKVGQRLGERQNQAAPFICSPILQDEIEDSQKPPFIKAKYGWFAPVFGCENIDYEYNKLTTNLSVVPSHHQISENASHMVYRTYFSDAVSIVIYRISFLVLDLLLQQVKAATKRAGEVGFADLSCIPELPMPGILQDLEDQVVTIVLDICQANGSNPLLKEIQDVILLLLQIAEKCLCLEFCVNHICEIKPKMGHGEIFYNKIKSLMEVADMHVFLVPVLTSLKQIIANVYSSLLYS